MHVFEKELISQSQCRDRQTMITLSEKDTIYHSSLKHSTKPFEFLNTGKCIAAGAAIIYTRQPTHQHTHTHICTYTTHKQRQMTV